MECFAHAGTAAVGTCRSCGKGICRDCARDLGFALACSERCATSASEIEDLTLRAKKARLADAIGHSETSFGGRDSPAKIGPVLIVFGLLCVGYASYSTFILKDLNLPGFVIGSAFLVLALYLRIRDSFKTDQNGNSS